MRGGPEALVTPKSGCPVKCIKIKGRPPSVALALEQGRLNLHGWVYDIETGGIVALDGTTRRFVPLAESPTVVAVNSRDRAQI